MNKKYFSQYSIYMKLGKKLNRKFHRLGRKADHRIHKLGQKTHDVLNKVQSGINKGLDKSANAINVADKILSVGDKTLHAINEAGLNTMPIIGTASRLLETGLHEGHKGTHKLRKLHNKAEKHNKKAFKKAHKAGNKLEKHNTRKALAKLQQDDSTFI